MKLDTFSRGRGGAGSFLNSESSLRVLATTTGGREAMEYEVKAGILHVDSVIECMGVEFVIYCVWMKFSCRSFFGIKSVILPGYPNLKIRVPEPEISKISYPISDPYVNSGTLISDVGTRTQLIGYP